MLIDINWYECNKILRLLNESHEDGGSYAGDDELEQKIVSHRNSIEAQKQWDLLDRLPPRNEMSR